MKRLFILLAALWMSACAAKRETAQLNSPDFDQLDFENPPIAEEEYEAQQRGEVPPQFDIPIVRNAKVEQWVEYFQGRGRKWFTVYLERSGKYIPFMRKILREHDLPEDLVYLAMIESGFSTRAFSRARAVGPWQFMKATGRLYGLQVNFWVDERRDPERSTIAAARHLKDLFDQFQSWKLAAAAYNAGAGKVSRAIKKYRTEDFWELSRGRYLRPETRHYVPKLIAAALVAKEPQKYGFESIAYESPLQYDKISLKQPINLIQMAEETQVSLAVLMDVNPELNHPVTPPNSKEYELRIPKGSSDAFQTAYDALTSGEKQQFAAHQVKRGENLGKIARVYRVSIAEIQKLNRMNQGAAVRQGQMILIPVPLDGKVTAADSAKKKFQQRPINLAETELQTNRVHVVRRGETLSQIARKYRISVAVIREENNLRRNRIFPGKRLLIPET